MPSRLEFQPIPHHTTTPLSLPPRRTSQLPPKSTSLSLLLAHQALDSPANFTTPIQTKNTHTHTQTQPAEGRKTRRESAGHEPVPPPAAAAAATTEPAIPTRGIQEEEEEESEVRVPIWSPHAPPRRSGLPAAEFRGKTKKKTRRSHTGERAPLRPLPEVSARWPEEEAAVA